MKRVIIIVLVMLFVAGGGIAGLMVLASYETRSLKRKIWRKEEKAQVVSPFFSA